jgi:hypothetical protein
LVAVGTDNGDDDDDGCWADTGPGDAGGTAGTGDDGCLSITDTDGDGGTAETGDDCCVYDTAAADPRKLSYSSVPSVTDNFAIFMTSGFCVSPESDWRGQKSNPIMDPITITAAIPPTTPPINVPLSLLLLAVDSPDKVGVVALSWLGTAAATPEGFVGGLIDASSGGKVGNTDGLAMFIATVGEGETTGAADTYGV